MEDLKCYLKQIKEEPQIGMFIGWKQKIINNPKIFYKILKFDSQIIHDITDNKLRNSKKTIKYLLKLKTKYDEQQKESLFLGSSIRFLSKKHLYNKKLIIKFLKKEISVYRWLPYNLKIDKDIVKILTQKIDKENNYLDFIDYYYELIPAKVIKYKSIQNLLKKSLLNIDKKKMFNLTNSCSRIENIYLNLSKKNKNNINIIINILKIKPSLLDFILLNSNINKDKLFKQLILLNIYEPFLYHKFNYKNYKLKTLLYILEKEPKLFRKLPLKYQKIINNKKLKT